MIALFDSYVAASPIRLVRWDSSSFLRWAKVNEDSVYTVISPRITDLKLYEVREVFQMLLDFPLIVVPS